MAPIGSEGRSLRQRRDFGVTAVEYNLIAALIAQ